MRRNQKTLELTKFSILLSIEALFCFTPLGSLPIGPIVATLAMIPVVITGILLGTKRGALMGFFAGFFSFLVWSFAPPNPLLAFVFSPFYSLGTYHGNLWSVVICIIPRVLTGAVAGSLYRFFIKIHIDNRFVRYGVSAFVGSMTNTVLVLFGMAIFFGSQISEIAGKALYVFMGTTILFSGIPEALIAMLAAFAVCRPLEKQINK